MGQTGSQNALLLFWICISSPAVLGPKGLISTSLLLQLLRSTVMLSKHCAWEPWSKWSWGRLLSTTSLLCSFKSYITTVQFNRENCSGQNFAATWEVDSSITEGPFLSMPFPWKQQEDFWAWLIDSFISWFHWDTIHLDIQLISKEEGAQRGSSIISSTIVYQRQLPSGRIPP